MDTANTIDAKAKKKRKSRLPNPLDPPIVYIARRFGGSKAKEWERFLRFFVVGALGAVIDLGILMISQATFLPSTDELGNDLPTNVAIATALAFSAAVISNFIWTTLWVYPDSQTHSKKKQLIQFSVVSVIGGVARTIWVRQTFVWIGQLATPVVLPIIRLYDSSYLVGVDEVTRVSAENDLGAVVTQLIAMVVVMFWNFFVNRYWTYNDVD